MILSSLSVGGGSLRVQREAQRGADANDQNGGGQAGSVAVRERGDDRADPGNAE
jgi:hypothetical protein